MSLLLGDHTGREDFHTLSVAPCYPCPLKPDPKTVDPGIAELDDHEQADHHLPDGTVIVLSVIFK